MNLEGHVAAIVELPGELFDYSIVRFQPIRLWEANAALVAWRHRMGALERGNQGARCHGLYHRERLVAVTTVSDLIMEADFDGFAMRRDTCCELSRLCAERSGLCRVALRLWREFAFPSLGYRHAISYQDADLHSGNTYRFDGWERIARSRSGKDTRSGRPGRDKWVWLWPPRNAEVLHVSPEGPAQPPDGGGASNSALGGDREGAVG